MTQFAEIAIHGVIARQESQYGRTANRQAVEANFQALVVGSISQSTEQSIGGVLLAVSRQVDLGEVQIELRLAPAHANRRTAKFFGFSPFLLGSRDCHSQIGNVEGIGWFFFKGAFEMGQGLYRIAPAQKREAGAKLLKCLDLDHTGVLHWVGATSPRYAIQRPGPFLMLCQIKAGG